jgi:hypothetical protein
MCETRQGFRGKMRVTRDTRPGLPSPCWEWTGSIDCGWHGRVKIGGRNVHVRRTVAAAGGEKLGPESHVIALCGKPVASTPAISSSAPRRKPARSDVLATWAWAT